MNKRLTSSVLAGFMLFNLSDVTIAAYKDVYTDIYEDIIIDENIFSDEMFRSWILDKNNLNGIGEDGILTYDERMSVKSIDVSEQKISDLQGIEVFTNLEELDCSRNSLTTLDLSENTLLKTVNCSYNQISELSLINQPDLSSLSCNYNRLTYLDVSNKPKLRALSCEYNYIEQLNITGNTSLEWLNVRTNLLKELDTTDNVKLKVIEAFDNRLETINVATLSDLEFLNVATNRLKELDLSQNTNLSVMGGGFAASNNILEKIILPLQPNLQIELSSFEEQDPISGYDRVKWFKDEDFNIELTDSISAQGQTIYSKRIPNDYKVYFSANGGNGTMQPQSAVYDEEFALTDCTFTKTGYIFNGWNTMPKGNGISYDDTENIINLSGKNNGGRITLYAQWTPIEYEIQFDANSIDAEGSMETQTAVYNSDLTLPECGFTVDGKEFAGWANEPGSHVRYSQGASVKNLASSQGETAVLYAVWKTPVKELQKPYLTELEQNFNKYSSSNYTSEDWDLISKAYHNAELLILAESDTDNMRIYCDNAAEEMASVMTKNDRIEEIVQKWTFAHNEVIQNVNNNLLNEDSYQDEFNKAEAAINEMTPKELEKYSSLSNLESLEKTAEEALDEINIHFDDLAAYVSASKWVDGLNDTAKRPLNEVRTDSFEMYQSLNTQYEQLPEKEKLQIDNNLKIRLQERLSLVSQKLSAVTELKGVYYSIDQTEYTDFSRENLAKALNDGIAKIEMNASEEEIFQGLLESKQDILSVLPNEEAPSSPDNGDSDDDNNGGNGDSGNDNEDNSDNENNGGSSNGGSSGSGSGSSSGSGGGSGNNGNSGSGEVTVPTYKINILNTENGTIATNVNQASKETVVTITATPQEEYRIKTIDVLDSVNNTVTLTKDEHNKYTFIMPESDVTIKAEFVKEHVLSFNDVEADSWYYDAVCYVNENGLFNGISEDTFGTDVNMLRSMLMTVLYRAAGEPEVKGEHGFTDVEDGMWYTTPIKWAKQNGIASGEDDNTFAPHKSVTREQLVTMLYRYASTPEITVDLQEFSDAKDIDEYAVKAFTWAVNNGIINGMGDGTLNPKGEATRAQVAQIIMKFLENKLYHIR